MTYEHCMSIFGINDIMDLPSAALKIVIGDTEARDLVYFELMKANNFDMSIDWFQEIYESEMSEGKRKGQHFTPKEVYCLVSELTGISTGSVHEPTAGTGGLIIGDWWSKASSCLPWEYFPSEHQYCAWELSARAVPLLLLNMSVRGIMGTVYHGDVLEQTIIKKYLLVNPTNDSLGFSDVVCDDNMNLSIIGY